MWGVESWFDAAAKLELVLAAKLGAFCGSRTGGFAMIQTQRNSEGLPQTDGECPAML